MAIYATCQMGISLCVAYTDAGSTRAGTVRAEPTVDERRDTRAHKYIRNSAEVLGKTASDTLTLSIFT